MSFTINIAKGVKKKPVSKKPNKISRLCTGVTVKEDGQYKIRISLINDPEFPDYIVIPFTEKSLSLVGKTVVYEHKKDKNNHYIQHIRDEFTCKFHPGSPSQYTVVVEGEICSGYVVRNEGNLYFELNNTHGRGNFIRDLPVRLNETTPLFPIKDEHNTSKSS